MGLLLAVALLASVIWWLQKGLGNKAAAAEAEGLARGAAKGVQRVYTDVLGGIAGQGAPDLGPPPKDGFSDESDHQIRVELPPRPPQGD